MKKNLDKKTLTKNQKITIITACSIVGVIALAVLIFFIYLAVPESGEESTEHFYFGKEYTSDYAFTINKDPTKDFKILTIADTQLADVVDPFGPGDPIKEMDELVDRVKPDLIIMMGDVTWTALTKLSLKKFVKEIDKYNIPWAPIMGNHEDEKLQGYPCAIDKNWIADKYLKANNCLFKKGPNNIGGVGNYVINIKENNKILQSFLMLDSHAKRRYSEYNNEWHYDYIYESQKQWYKWVMDGLTKENNNVRPESMLYIHIPLCEYNDAYDYWEESGFDPNIGFGNKNEKVWCPYINNGMFDFVKSMGTKFVFAGHDHLNNYSVLFEGVRLTYVTKTGFKTSYQAGQTGGTVITLGKESGVNTVNIHHELIEY